MSDQDPRYQIDVILEEARRKKQERLKHALRQPDEDRKSPAVPEKSGTMLPRFMVPSGAPESKTGTDAELQQPSPRIADTAEQKQPITAVAALASVARPTDAETPKPVQMPKSFETLKIDNKSARFSVPKTDKTIKPDEMPVSGQAPGLDQTPERDKDGKNEPAPKILFKKSSKAVPLWDSVPKAREADDVKVYIPKPAKTSSQKDTIVFDDTASQKSKGNADVEPAEDGRVRTDIPEKQKQVTETEEKTENPNPQNHENWEEQVKTKRKKKVDDFHLQAPAKFKFSGEEEVNEPNEELEVFEDEEIEDFGSYEETDTVRSELTYRRRIGLAKLILTGLTVLALVGLSVAMYILKLPALNPVLFIGLNVFLLGIAVLLNHRIFGEGLGSLFRLHATADSAAGFTALVVLLHTLAQVLNLGAVADGEAVILTPVAALGLFFSALGKHMRLQRISDNFLFVSYRGDKYTAKIVDDERMADEIGRTAVDIGVPVVCYAEKTKFLSHFLENSYQTDKGDRAMRRYMPYIVLVSLAVALVYGYSSHDMMNTLTVFATAVCLSAPFGVASTTNFPFLRTARRALRHGAMMVGPQAVEEFGGIHALAVDALDLFPSESVLLHGIKTFSGSRIDEAILDAAAVSIAAGGPLSSVFRRVIQNRVDILKKVDTLVYEQDMGMSGWVGGRRVLVGNRKLLENHGVDVPSHDYEARYTKSDRRIVYLSTAGELSAMFVVSYTADAGIAKALDAMTSAGITLLVNTCDPNITEDLICREYELDPFYVEVMGASAGRCYERLTAEDSEKSDAILATNGRLEGLAYGITYCRRLHRAVPLAITIQIIGGALGFALSALFSLYTSIFLPPLFILAYGSLWILLSWLLPAIHRI